eukprot:TRINITY_DN5646_c1_g3_i1.p1 TRINITY_DN5646_c1_g3~~TRINITY_DN5646_c1_g3_i1.p1  ORF type:complete len:195 (+),score=-9.12 TRINITY_DN5646_c1_g3_i1:293-877(+)
MCKDNTVQWGKSGSMIEFGCNQVVGVRKVTVTHEFIDNQTKNFYTCTNYVCLQNSYLLQSVLQFTSVRKFLFQCKILHSNNAQNQVFVLFEKFQTCESPSKISEIPSVKLNPFQISALYCVFQNTLYAYDLKYICVFIYKEFLYVLIRFNKNQKIVFISLNYKLLIFIVGQTNQFMKQSKIKQFLISVVVDCLM